MFQFWLSVFVIALCAVLMLRLLMGERLRGRFDAVLSRASFVTRRRAYLMWHWRSSRRSAERMAQDAIRRARDGGSWDGNVYRPKSFKRPRKPH